MGSRTIKFDDLDSTQEAAETLTFSLDADAYSIDLSSGNADKLRKALAPFLKVGRPMGLKELLKLHATTSSNGTEVDSTAVRAWAAQNNITLNPKGRIPGDIVEKYVAAQASK